MRSILNIESACDGLFLRREDQLCGRRHGTTRASTTLQKAGQRLTRHRVSVMAALRTSDRPVTAEEVAKEYFPASPCRRVSQPG